MRSTAIYIRCAETEKAAIEKAAHAANQSVTEFILNALAVSANFERVPRRAGKQTIHEIPRAAFEHRTETLEAHEGNPSTVEEWWVARRKVRNATPEEVALYTEIQGGDDLPTVELVVHADQKGHEITHAHLELGNVVLRDINPRHIKIMEGETNE
jgi:hypothetical protein